MFAAPDSKAHPWLQIAVDRIGHAFVPGHLSSSGQALKVAATRGASFGGVRADAYSDYVGEDRDAGGNFVFVFAVAEAVCVFGAGAFRDSGICGVGAKQ